jgi:hypothetical protein
MRWLEQLKMKTFPIKFFLQRAIRHSKDQKNIFHQRVVPIANTRLYAWNEIPEYGIEPV